MITRNIPNTITSCNLFCGCIASYMAFHGNYELALLFIVLGATFDFMSLLPSEKNWIRWPTTSRSDWHRLPLLFPCLKRYITRIFYSRCQESCPIRPSLSRFFPPCDWPSLTWMNGRPLPLSECQLRLTHYSGAH